jgi:hypothetical protein
MLQCSRALRVVYLAKRRVFERVKQDDLALGVLDKAKKQSDFFGRGVIFEKIVDNLGRTFADGKTFLAFAVEKRKQNARFIDAVERQREKQAVVKLKFDADRVLIFLQCFRRCLNHKKIVI